MQENKDQKKLSIWPLLTQCYGRKLSDDNEFLYVKWFEGQQVSVAIENTQELEESDDQVIDDSDSDQSNY